MYALPILLLCLGLLQGIKCTKDQEDGPRKSNSKRSLRHCNNWNVRSVQTAIPILDLTLSSDDDNEDNSRNRNDQDSAPANGGVNVRPNEIARSTDARRSSTSHNEQGGQGNKESTSPRRQGNQRTGVRGSTRTNNNGHRQGGNAPNEC